VEVRCQQYWLYGHADSAETSYKHLDKLEQKSLKTDSFQELRVTDGLTQTVPSCSDKDVSNTPFHRSQT